MSREYDKHHVIFPRRDYTKPVEKRLRNHTLFIVRGLRIATHRDLHAVLQPPRKLSPDQTHHAVSLLNELKEDGMDQITAIGEIATQLSRRSDREHLFAENLRHQLEYIDGGL